MRGQRDVTVNLRGSSSAGHATSFIPYVTALDSSSCFRVEHGPFVIPGKSLFDGLERIEHRIIDVRNSVLNELFILSFS